MTCEIVIPCYNESLRLPSFLAALAYEVSKQPFTGRITIVDDGSEPEDVGRLLVVIAPIIAAHPDLFQPPLLLPKNVGKGAALYTSWRQALNRGAQFLSFVDADGSTSAEEFCRLIRYMIKSQAECDGVLGSRVMMLGKIIQRDFHRHLIGRCFATMASELMGVKAYDTQCGAKVFKREMFEAVEPLLLETGFVFDVELILVALQRGFILHEFPVCWQEVKGSKVRIFREIFRMALSLIRIRKRHGRLADSLLEGNP